MKRNITVAMRNDPGRTLYAHRPHPHTPTNVNEAHKAERTLNTRIAVLLTRSVGTMWVAYVFALIGIGSLIGVFTGDVFLALLFGSLSSYFLQLVLLPILSVGQNVLSRHQELQADEAYQATMKSFHDVEEIATHLEKQDEELLRQSKMLETILKKAVGE